MTTANAKFSNVVAYSITKLGVKLQEQFQIELPNHTGPTEWYSNNDAVLDISQQDNTANILAAAIGECKLRIFDVSMENVLFPLLEIKFEVFETAPQAAVDLGLKVGTPEYKAAAAKTEKWFKVKKK